MSKPGLDERLVESLDRAAGVLEDLPGGVLVDPVAEPLVVGQPEVSKGRHGAEGRGLGAEVGAAEEDGLDRVADRLVDPRQVRERDLALAVEKLVNVVAAAGQRHVPLGDVADALGVLQERGGHQGDVAQARCRRSWR